MAKHTKIEYYEIAAIQIDRAIQLYFEEDFVCAITLAGAGEEILGTLLEAQGKENSITEVLQELKKKEPTYSIKELRDILNLPRNALKHVKEEVFETNLPIKESSQIMIRRAIINYAQLRKFKTKFMDDFIQQDN
jgi:hypothetical protein